MSVFVIADTHLGNEKLVLNDRKQFSGVDEHDTTILKNILATCGKNDTLYIVGDAVEITDRLPILKTICDSIGRVYIVLGNHDSKPNTHSNRPSTQDLLNCGARELFGMTAYRHCTLTHAPLHSNMCNLDNGWRNVHGHLHGKIEFGPQYLNISCPAIDYVPFNLDEWINAL